MRDQFRPEDLIRFTNVAPPRCLLKRVSYIRHLPAVRVAPEMNLSLGLGGSLMSLGCEQWKDLEGPAAFDWDDYYGDHQAFFLGTLDKEQWSDEVDIAGLVGFGDHAAFWNWLLLTISYGRFLPHPRLSLCYVLLREIDSELRVGRFPGTGDLDCLRLPVYLEVKHEHHRRLAENGEILMRSVENGSYQSLRQLTEPFTYCLTRDEVAECWLDFTCQLEFLINPYAEPPLAKQFAHRFALICAVSSNEHERFVETGRLLYRFRSELLHGQALDPASELVSMLGSDYPFPAGIILRMAEFLSALSKAAVRTENGVAGCFTRDPVARDTFSTMRRLECIYDMPK